MLLRIFIRQQKKEPTPARAVEIANKRSALDTRVDKLFLAAHSFMSENGIEAIPEIPLNDPDEREEDYDDEQEQPAAHMFAEIEADRGEQPEHRRLPLPSVLGKEKCEELGLVEMMNKERGLRLGQANDALSSVQLAVGQKSFLFRHKLRNAQGRHQTTRSWDNIHAANRKVMQHKWVYTKAREALLNLDTPADIMINYPVMTIQDVRATTAVTDSNARGQRKEQLSWIWTVNTVPRGNDETDLMTECELSQCQTTHWTECPGQFTGLIG